MSRENHAFFVSAHIFVHYAVSVVPHKAARRLYGVSGVGTSAVYRAGGCPVGAACAAVDECSCELWSRSFFASGALSKHSRHGSGGIDTGAHGSNVKVAMTRTLLSRDGASSIFLAIMTVCLPLAVVGEMIAIFLHRGVVRTDLATGADVFGWLFTVAFLLTMLLTIFVEERRLSRRARAR
jgi:hypothetical protein